MTVHALRASVDQRVDAGGQGDRPASVLFDIPIDLAPPTDVLQTITGWAAEQNTRRVMYVIAHVVNQTRVTPGLAEALSSIDARVSDMTARTRGTP